MARLFGTDGVRGLANTELTPELAFRLGWAAAWYFGREHEKPTFLIGRDTRSKHKYVRWEIQVAIEKGCNLIGVNLDGRRHLNPDLCPPVMQDVGAVFVPYSAAIIAYALGHTTNSQRGNYHFPDGVYKNLGYEAV